MKTKIGIIITPNLFDEYLKNELVDTKLLSEEEKVCYINNIPDKYKEFDNETGKYISSDLMIVNYLKCMYDNAEIKILNPNTLTAKDLAYNDLNFILTFDLLEAFHKMPSKKFKNYKKIIANADNIYPDMSFQHFVNHKSIYYTYLRDNGINVQDFFIVNSDNYMEDLRKLFKYKKQKNWGDYIVKPVYGQESIDLNFLKEYDTIEDVQTLIEEILSQNSYPGFVFQKEINNMMLDGTPKREYRIYFFGEDFAYLLSEKWGFGSKHNLGVEVTRNSKPKNITQLHHDIINFGTKVLQSLFKNKIKGIELKHLLIRIDMTFDNNDEIIVSEVEFVPSLMVELIDDNPEFKQLNLHEILATEIAEITNDYNNKNMKRVSNEKESEHIYPSTISTDRPKTTIHSNATDKPISTRFSEANDRLIAIKSVDMTKSVTIGTDRPKTTIPSNATDKPISTRFPEASDRLIAIKPVDMTKLVTIGTDRPKSTIPVTISTDRPKSTIPSNATDKPDSFKLSGITNKEKVSELTIDYIKNKVLNFMMQLKFF